MAQWPLLWFQTAISSTVTGINLETVATWLPTVFPAVTSVNRIRRVKPGAVTLVEGKVPRGGRAGVPDGEQARGYEQPLLVYQRYGRGLAVALPIQDSWTWAFGADIPVGDPTFPIFWRQLLRFLTADVPARVTAHAAADQVTTMITCFCAAFRKARTNATRARVNCWMTSKTS